MIEQNPLITPASPYDIPHIISLIEERIEWMETKGIIQWHRHEYLELYDFNYFLQSVTEKRLYKAELDGRIVGGFTLSLEDRLWPQGENAYYIRNLVTKKGYPGIGKSILLFCERKARQDGKKFLRLDCIAGNKKLNQYYEDAGFLLIEPFTLGKYAGHKREKRLM